MNTWCGPYAIGFVLGISTDAAAQLVKDHRRNNAAVKGTFVGELRCIFDKFGKIAQTLTWEKERPKYGFKPLKVYSGREGIFGERLKPDGRPTIAQFLRERPDRSATYVVSVPGHWLVIKGNKIYDNQHPQGLLSSEWPKRRRRVEFAWRMN